MCSGGGAGLGRRARSNTLCSVAVELLVRAEARDEIRLSERRLQLLPHVLEVVPQAPLPPRRALLDPLREGNPSPPPGGRAGRTSPRRVSPTGSCPRSPCPRPTRPIRRASPPSSPPPSPHSTTHVRQEKHLTTQLSARRIHSPRRNLPRNSCSENPAREKARSVSSVNALSLFRPSTHTPKLSAGRIRASNPPPPPGPPGQRPRGGGDHPGRRFRRERSGDRLRGLRRDLVLVPSYSSVSTSLSSTSGKNLDTGSSSFSSRCSPGSARLRHGVDPHDLLLVPHPPSASLLPAFATNSPTRRR